MPERRSFTTVDGAVLEGEYSAPAGPARTAVVLCHPLPSGGGTMRSLVTSALFDALPGLGHACLRFNFRGVEGSTGTFSGGTDEPVDVAAAIDAIAGEPVGGAPIALVGWSFGADMALSVTDPRVAGWVAIAAPLRFGGKVKAVAADERPKHLVLAQHDEFRAPDSVTADVADWTNTTAEVVPGASHFFVGRTDRVVAATDAFLGRL